MRETRHRGQTQPDPPPASPQKRARADSRAERGDTATATIKKSIKNQPIRPEEHHEAERNLGREASRHPLLSLCYNLFLATLAATRCGAFFYCHSPFCERAFYLWPDAAFFSFALSFCFLANPMEAAAAVVFAARPLASKKKKRKGRRRFQAHESHRLCERLMTKRKKRKKEKTREGAQSEDLACGRWHGANACLWLVD
nr:hypothetical protein [Pandoravirus massiliensis]